MFPLNKTPNEINFFEREVSHKKALFFLMLTPLEFAMIFTPLPFFLYRTLGMPPSFIITLESIAVVITIYVLGSCVVQEIKSLNLRLFRIGFFLGFIFGLIQLISLFTLPGQGGPVIFMLNLVNAPFDHLANFIDPLFSSLWGLFLGAMITFTFIYLVLAPLLTGFVVSGVDYG